jgi:Domain of unknown function (DUF4156)
MVIMDGGQHGPPRREVWSYLQNHSALFKQASGESFVLISPLPEEANKVRIVSNSPHLKECKYFGEIRGEGEVRFIATDSAIHESARRNLKEAAAKAGAKTVEVTNEATRSFAGEAYKCDWK